MARRKNGMPKVTPDLSGPKLTKGSFKPMLKSGFCQFGPGPAHVFCTGPVNAACPCECHTKTDN